jgi:hypothetical protein
MIDTLILFSVDEIEIWILDDLFLFFLSAVVMLGEEIECREAAKPLIEIGLIVEVKSNCIVVLSDTVHIFNRSSHRNIHNFLHLFDLFLSILNMLIVI